MYGRDDKGKAPKAGIASHIKNVTDKENDQELEDLTVAAMRDYCIAVEKAEIALIMWKAAAGAPDECVRHREYLKEAIASHALRLVVATLVERLAYIPDT